MVAGDADDGQHETVVSHRTQGLTGGKVIDQQSTVGWTPAANDWLSAKARPVTSRGMYRYCTL